MPVRTGCNRPSRVPSTVGTPALVESFERRLLLAIDVMIGAGQPAQAVTFTDADGTTAQVRVTGGAATVTFDAPDVAQSTTGRLATVTGTGVAMTNVALGGTNPNVTVRTAGGDGTVALAGLNAAGPVRRFSGRGVILGGTSTLSSGIGTLELGGTQGATITINPPGQGVPDASVTIVGAADARLFSQQPIRLLRVGSWLRGDLGDPNAVVAPRINVLQSDGDFNADLTMSGDGRVTGPPILGNAKVRGAVRGVWFVANAPVGRIAAGSLGPGWIAGFSNVGSITTAGDLSGSLTAAGVNTLSAGSITECGMSLTSVNRLSVRGAITDSAVRSRNIGAVSAASMTNSVLFAGVANPGGAGGALALPSSAAALVPPGGIRSVTLRARGAASFVNSNIAAATLGRINLGTVHVTTGGTPFGLAADTIASVSGTRDDTGEPARAARLTEPADSIDLGDFEVRVF
jgi:hypothetical protein